ncbi:MAG: ATP-binding protein [Muribaculaceae bacterium]|nr:ATP-binding protein [Muribaculaceae bacterium]
MALVIKRERYLKQLIRLRDNGQVKIITGIRRCGKSFLLNRIFASYLMLDGVGPANIIQIDLDDDTNARYRNPMELSAFIRSRIFNNEEPFYVLIDEIQQVGTVPNPYLPNANIGFTDVLNGLRNIPNVDVYVTGSNSKMLSSDIATEFRGRGDIIRLHPLTYDEFYEAFQGEKRLAWREFITYGGMPKILSIDNHEDKAKYLSELFSLIYIKDIIERNKLRASETVLDTLLNIVASSVGSLTNPTKIADTFTSIGKIKIKNETVARYLECFIDAFILSKAIRYDIKGRSYIESPLKYYYTDAGLRNAKINFRQQEENHIMENVLYNEFKARGFNIDVGIVPHRWKDSDGKTRQTALEVDFILNKGNKQYYIQSALTIANEEKRMQEINSLSRVDDSFDKIVIVKDDILPWTDDKGIRYINVEEFLLKDINDL